MIQPWSLDFDCRTSTLSKVIAWVRIPGLSFRYYHKITLRVIGALLGEVVKIDYLKESRGRGRFARLAILIDLHKSLVPWIKADGMSYRVEYEGLPHIYFSCSKYGHTKERCGKINSDQDPARNHAASLQRPDGGPELFSGGPSTSQTVVHDEPAIVRPGIDDTKKATTLTGDLTSRNTVAGESSEASEFLSSAFRAMETFSSLDTSKHTVVTIPSSRQALEEVNRMFLDGQTESQPVTQVGG
ncbi:hypothetical protein K1719_032083 [Acacia pycnantha]|nr:hypothetical protein K1719_032083 [Acacia pycnantha]